MSERIFEGEFEGVEVSVVSASSGTVTGEDGVPRPHRRLELNVGVDQLTLRTWNEVCGLLGALYIDRHSRCVTVHHESCFAWGFRLPSLTVEGHDELDAAVMAWARVERRRRGL